ncbi:MAG: DEAD/DEAH box helicase family protein [Gammaproteobacteria bacterium]|nr:DEAD/DEAH box helicase family protein [Gammaproteobacteria bacterium]
MTFDFSKIKSKKKETLPVDPIELFQKLKVSDPSINDLWLAQGDALRKWHENRTKRDVGIVLNTGAGKTLVGLLVAQSLVNETREKVLYACSSIQLVEQTAEKAKGYGLDVTTYFRGQYSSDLFVRGEAPCVTTYQALFNGRSVFFREQLSAIVFDDAHAAEHLLRDHFSLRLNRNTFPGVYAELAALFNPYYQKVGKAGSYSELEDPQCRRLFLVPPFEIHAQQGELLRILRASALQDNRETMFAWEYIHDHIDLCCMLVSGAEITITPPFVPVLSLPYFGRETRRVSLSATLVAPDAFARTFGRVPDAVAAPSTTAGECERLILIPSQLEVDREDTVITRELIKDRKTLILVPTYARATNWQGVAEPPPKESVSEYVRAFKADPGTPKLLLAARYDGVDFPGDTCRVMVIDDLPMGVGPLERYMWEYLSLSNTLRTAIASRIVQSFGRISRGMSDHGVVILTGERLVDWVLVPRNRAVLPPFLQKQIVLGYEVSAHADEVKELYAAADQCLARDENWLATYNEYMKTAEPDSSEVDTELLTRLARSESDYASLIWRRDYHGAAKVLSTTLEEAFSLSVSTGAWHCLWLGHALELLGDAGSAQEMYSRAHSNQLNIPAYPREIGKEYEAVPSQVMEVDSQLKILADGAVILPKRIDADLAHLDGSGTAGQTEESLRALGQYLGFQSTSPDHEFGTGPDVLWVIDGQSALCIEVKTDKKSTTPYRKEDVGQLSDHVQWVKDQIGSKEIIPIFVGPIIGVTDSTNPPKEYKVVALEQFHILAHRLIAALKMLQQLHCLSHSEVTCGRCSRREGYFGQKVSVLWKAIVFATY